MKRIIALLLVLAMTVCLFAACNSEEKPGPGGEDNPPVVKDFGKIFYVAVDGNDENEGTKESPLATLGGAVSKVREYKTANGLPEGGIKVEFAAGTYKVTEQTALTAEDSGEDGKPIVYAAADGAEVIFDGGISLNPADFKPANDDFKAKLVSDEAKKNVLEIDLTAAGIWDADDSTTYTYGWYGSVYRQSLYINNELQTVARWPNGEYYPAVFPDNAKEGVKILFPEEKATLWSNETNIRAYGYPEKDWDSKFLWNLSLEPGTSLLDVGINFILKQFIYVFNIACELDEPGEYYWDVAANKLYYWPVEGFETGKISFSQFKESVIYITDTDYVSFDGLTFENLRYRAINAEKSSNADHVTINNCIFRCIASNPIQLNGSSNTIIGNEMYNLGSGGISVQGGNIAKQISSETIVTNNVIHDWSQVYTVYNAAITTNGTGFVISHNELYNAPHEAIAFNSGLTTIEYNNIHNVCKETSDAGAIYSGRRWDWGNNDIRYNYVHDVIDEMHGGRPNGIYLDDSIAFQHVYGNIVVNVGGVGITGGGVNNCRIENNVVCLAGVHSFYNNNNGIGALCWNTLYPDGSVWTAVKSFMHNDFWRYAFPSLSMMLENMDVHNSSTEPLLDIGGFPGYNSWKDNVVYGCKTLYYIIHNGIEETIVITCGTNEWEASIIGNNLEYKDGQLEDVFVDPANGNFFLKEDSKVYRDIIGFEKWDYALIGPQK